MHFFKEIHIKSFKGLENINLNKVGSVNLIVSSGNFGKSSFLEALKIMLEPVSLCRSYNYFLKNYHLVDYWVFEKFFPPCNKIEFEWKIDELDYFDRLVGSFEKDDFSGYHYSQITNNELGINNSFSSVVNMTKNQPLFEEQNFFTEDKYKYMDFVSLGKYKKIHGYHDFYYKQYILNFIRHYNEDVSGIFVNQFKHIVFNDKNIGYINGEFFGSFLYYCSIMELIIESCSEKILMIDNLDAMTDQKNSEAFINMLIGSVEYKKCQSFFTLRTGFFLDEMLKVFYLNKRLKKLTVTVLYKDVNTGHCYSRSFSGEKAYKMRFEDEMDLRSLNNEGFTD